MKNKLESLHLTLKELSEEVGVYALGSWRYSDKLTLQCTSTGLDSFMKKHNLEYTDHIKNIHLSDGILKDEYVYETESFKLFTWKVQNE